MPALVLAMEREGPQAGHVPAWPDTWTVAHFNRLSPSRPTRGLCPSRPRSPSEGRGLQVLAKAGPPLRSPAPERWRPLCELPLRLPYLLPRTDAGRRAPAPGVTRTQESARTHRLRDADARPWLGRSSPASPNTLCKARRQERAKMRSLPARRPLLTPTARFWEADEDVPQAWKGAMGHPTLDPAMAWTVSVRCSRPTGCTTWRPQNWCGGGEGCPPEQDAAVHSVGGEERPPYSVAGSKRGPSAAGESRREGADGFPRVKLCALESSEAAPRALEEVAVARQTQTTIKGRKPRRQCAERAQGPVRARGVPAGPPTGSPT